jgi:hypothetical protein
MKSVGLAVAVLVASVAGIVMTANDKDELKKINSNVVIAAAAQMDRPIGQVSSRGSLSEPDDCGYIKKNNATDGWERIVLKDLCDDDKERARLHPKEDVDKKAAAFREDMADFFPKEKAK